MSPRPQDPPSSGHDSPALLGYSMGATVDLAKHGATLLWEPVTVQPTMPVLSRRVRRVRRVRRARRRLRRQRDLWQREVLRAFDVTPRQVGLPPPYRTSERLLGRALVAWVLVRVVFGGNQ